MNFHKWFTTSEDKPSFMFDAEMGWDACKLEVLKIIKSKYPKYVGDLVYEDGWDTACMSIEEEIDKL